MDSINISQISNIQQAQTKPSMNNIQSSPSFPNGATNEAASPIQQFLMIPEEFSNKNEFYECLIRLLKSMGCLLNHIRP